MFSKFFSGTLVKLFLLFVGATSFSFGQTQGTIYLFPGQGSDSRIFDSIDFDSAYKTKVIEYDTPEKGMSMSNFAQQLINQIDTTENYILLGVSLGGMLCVEINEILSPKKTIIISSAKNCRELPIRYRFQKVIPIYKLVPKKMILAGAKILQPIVEPDRKKNKTVFKSMLAAKDARYMKRTVGLIIHWDRTENSKDVVHIHGTKDHTIPLRNIKNPRTVVQNGSHMMTLTRAEEIQEIVNSILANCDPAPKN
jgi:pimeloyl-ACP methyl ester carboxylesterase